MGKLFLCDSLAWYDSAGHPYPLPEQMIRQERLRAGLAEQQAQQERQRAEQESLRAGLAE